jgi:putative phosphoesterase
MPAVTRIGIIGDIHGQVKALEAALHFFAETVPPLDVLLCTGDLPEKGAVLSADTAGTVSTCARLLQANDVLTVRGNHDRHFLDNSADSLLQDLFPEEWAASADALAFARTLPVTRTLETAMGPLLLCHGVGLRDTEGIYPGGAEEQVVEALAAREIASPAVHLLVMGHTHRWMYRTVAGIILLNPGTLLPEKPASGLAILDTGEKWVQFYAVEPATGTITTGERFIV